MHGQNLCAHMVFWFFLFCFFAASADIMNHLQESRSILLECVCVSLCVCQALCGSRQLPPTLCFLLGLRAAELYMITPESVREPSPVPTRRLCASVCMRTVQASEGVCAHRVFQHPNLSQTFSRCASHPPSQQHINEGFCHYRVC